MNIKLEKGNLILDLSSLFDLMSGEEKVKLIESLSCEDAIIKHVADQLLDKWTENSYCGSTGWGESQPRTPIDVARREIAKRAGGVAKREVEDMERNFI